MKYCLTTLYDDNFSSFAPLVIKSFEKFSIINKCELVVFDKPIDPSIHSSWNKLLVVKKCFESYDGVFWCDADSLFTGKADNFADDVINNNAFITNGDFNGICLSHFYMANSSYNKSLIDTLLFLKDVKNDSEFGIGPKWEQNTLKALMLHFNIPHSFMKENTVVDYVYHNKSYSNTFFYHFSNLDNKTRYSLIKLVFEKDYQHF